MKYLIDTHIFLWSLFSPQKISDIAREVIEDSANTVFVSVLTFWEISLKFSLKKLELEGITPDELPGFASKLNYQILRIKSHDAASFYRLPRVAHKDPFDRMIIWQAIRQDLVLISNDRQLSAYEQYGLSLLPASKS